MTPPDETGDNTVRITIKDVYALLLDVKKSVDSTSGHSSQLDDHEKRLRVVERNLWIVVGVGIVAQLAAPFLWPLVLNG